jgi:putative transposase
VWSTDITYIKTKGGMVYLAAIIDWHSKAIPSHGISNTSDIHTQHLKNKGITISMDGKGRATDNICIERFWRNAKCEWIYLNEYESIAHLKESVNDYITFYNHKRFHQTLD